jgi:protein arginine N-methyltransferase 1
VLAWDEDPLVLFQGGPAVRQINIASPTKAFPSILNHVTLLEDEVRVGAFQAAIAKTVRPGDVVVDVGTGTGILACFAARAGARKVYAIEETDLITLAANLARENGLDGRIVFLRGNSLDVPLPERADVLVTETLGHLPFEEGILRIVADARRRFLMPEARVVPGRLNTYLVPLGGWDLHRAIVGFWRRRVGGLDLGAARRAAAGLIYKGWIEEEEFLARPRLVWSVRLDGWMGNTLESAIRFPIERPGRLSGLGGWFEACLARRVTINTFRGTTWRNFVLPLGRPLQVEAGDRLEVRLRLEELRRGHRIQWHGSLSGGRGVVPFSGAAG